VRHHFNVLQQWDLNTGHAARRFPSHGAQLTTIAVRPLSAPVPTNFNPYTGGMSAIATQDMHMASSQNADIMLHGKRTTDVSVPRNTKPNGVTSSEMSDDAEGDTDNDYDPLFDDEGEGEVPAPAHPASFPLQTGIQPNGTQHAGPPSNVVPPLQMPGASAALPPGAFQPMQYQNTTKNFTPVLDPASYTEFSPDIFMTAGIDGQITLWDRRASSRGVGRLELPEKIPPWCMSVCLQKPAHLSRTHIPLVT
jgi:transcriptional activator SPT8